MSDQYSSVRVFAYMTWIFLSTALGLVVGKVLHNNFGYGWQFHVSALLFMILLYISLELMERYLVKIEKSGE